MGIHCPLSVADFEQINLPLDPQLTHLKMGQIYPISVCQTLHTHMHIYMHMHKHIDGYMYAQIISMQFDSELLLKINDYHCAFLTDLLQKFSKQDM